MLFNRLQSLPELAWPLLVSVNEKSSLAAGPAGADEESQNITSVAYSPAGTATSIAAETMRSMRTAINHRNTALASAKKNQHLEDMAIKHVGIDDRILNGSRNERKEML